MKSTAIEIEVFKKGQNVIWDRFVKSCPNFTFYQAGGFLDYYSFKAESVLKIAFKKNNKIIASIAGGLKDKGGLAFYSPFSASFGGFCCAEGISLEDTVETVIAFTDYLRLNTVTKAVIRQTPFIYSRYLSEYIDFALLYNGYALQGQELTLYMESFNRVSDKVKRNIRKAQKSGLVLREEEKFETAYNFIRFHKEKKDFALSVTLEDLLYIRKMFPDRIKTFTVTREDRIIAAIMVYILNHTCALGFSWEQDSQCQQYRPSDFMIYKTAEFIFNGGYRFFDLGTVTLNGSPNFGLTRFKEGFGPCGALRKTFVKGINERG